MMLIILDRDGVINFESVDYIKSPQEWHPIPGSIEAIGRLSKAGFKIVIATNQSGIARGLYTVETLNKIHQKMLDLIKAAGGEIDRIYFCPHHPDDSCDCRKPAPGMLKNILSDYQITEKDCVFVGDSIRDLDAAKAIGCKFILVKTGNGLKSLQELEADDIPVADDLSHVAEMIIRK